MVVTNITSLVQSLASLGLSDYEARAYCALVAADHGRTAYEVAKDAGLPTSKIYEVLGRLRDRDLVVLHEDRDRKRYTAREPSDFLEAERSRIDATLTGLRDGFTRLRQGRSDNAIWNISDYDALLDRAVRMVEEATGEVLVSLCAPESAILADSLNGAAARGVKVAVVHFGQPIPALPCVHPHPLADTLQAERGGRSLTLVRDGAEALVATLGEDCTGAASTHHGFVLVAEDYIKHDIYLMKIVRRMDADLVARFGPNYAFLRDVFSDKENEHGHLD